MLNREPKDKVLASRNAAGQAQRKSIGAVLLVLLKICSFSFNIKIKKVATDSCHLVISF